MIRTSFSPSVYVDRIIGSLVFVFISNRFSRGHDTDNGVELGVENISFWECGWTAVNSINMFCTCPVVAPQPRE